MRTHAPLRWLESLAVAAASAAAALSAAAAAGMAVTAGMAAVAVGAGLCASLGLAARDRLVRSAAASAARPAEEVGALAAGLAHEIRNPLNTIRFNLRMLAEDLATLSAARAASEPGEAEDGAGGAREAGPEPAELSALVSATAGEAGRLERLLTAYLEFAKPERPPERREVRLDRLVEELLEFLREEYAAAGVAFLPDLARAARPVRTDPEALRRALLNVLKNAREARPGPAAIRVSAETGPGGRALVAVEDEGPGVPEEDRERIFDPFFSRREGGTGLGLAIARRAVESLGGEIRCEAGKRSGGARFVIEWGGE